MTNPFCLTVMFLLLATLKAPLCAQESEPKGNPDAGNQAPSLHLGFSDDFSKDIRGDYTIQGDVSWEKGTLTLGRQASIQCAISGGAWAEIELDVDLLEMTAKQTRSGVRVWFLFDDTTDCIVVLQSTSNDDRHTTTVALIDVGENEKEHVRKMLRRIQLKDLDIHRWAVAYRCGLVRVFADGRPVLVGFIGNRSTAVAGCRVQGATAMSVRISRLAVSSTPPAATLSSRQQEPIVRSLASHACSATCLLGENGPHHIQA